MNISRIKNFLLIGITSFVIITSTGASAAQPAYPGANGKPFLALQAQIDALSAATTEVLKNH